ncbi:MAG: hypothetical protein WA786_10100 [Acidimicrobiales bacterium]
MNEKGKKTLGIYLGFLLGEAICAVAFYVEVRRALGGNTLSWAYVVEWPLFGAYIIYMWRRLLREEKASHESIEGPLEVPGVPVDPALLALNEYYLAVHGLKDVSEIPPPTSKINNS